MVQRLHYEERIERRGDARIRRDERAFERYALRRDRANRMIGALVRDGITVLYVYPQGGRYREGTREELIDYIIRRGHA